MSFIPYYKPQFVRDVKTYASMKSQIEKKVKSILADPYHNTEPLGNFPGHDLRGLRSKRVDKNFRIIFAICEECKGRCAQVRARAGFRIGARQGG